MPFNEFVQRVFEREGYKSAHVADTGGLTIWGITERDHPEAVAMMSRMGREESQDVAAAIYRREYWDRVQGDTLEQIGGPDLADMVADTAVNAGVKTAGILLQKSLNRIQPARKKWDVIHVDGIIGAETLAAVGRAVICDKRRYQALIPKVYRYLRMDHYFAICEENPSQLVFLEGWLLRA